METAQAAPDWRAVIDEIRALIRESKESAEEQRKSAGEQRKLAEEQRKSAEEQLKSAEKQLKSIEAQRKKDDRAFLELRETQRELAERMKATDKQIGDLGHRFGDMVEHMVVPNLVKKFRDLGFEFNKAGPNVEIEDPE
ncbi:MAG: hypothetical protein LBT00_02065, partial [Spirochaetaceae bacterium]|nr:hypothetical protein [Spirochaetaceae bacterium]